MYKVNMSDTRHIILNGNKAEGFVCGAGVFKRSDSGQYWEVCAVPWGMFVGPGYLGTQQAIAAIETLLLHGSAWLVKQGY